MDLTIPSPKLFYKVLFMKEYVVKSKIYVVPKRKKILPFLLINICVIIIAIISLLSIFLDGVKLSNISLAIVSLIIAIGYKKMSAIKPYYMFSSAYLKFDVLSLLIKYDNGRTIILNYDTIESLEYSDRLECIRFVCDYSLIESGVTSLFESSEYLLYFSEKEYPECIKSLEENLAMKITYVDRT